jgi:hypothetical protein
MTHRAVRLVAVLTTVAALVAIPSGAQATTPPAPPAVQPTIVMIPLGASPVSSLSCALPYLATSYGPIAQCTKIFSNVGLPGLYSPFTGGFSHGSTYYPVKLQDLYYATVQSTDGVSGLVIGYATLVTTRDPSVWVTQYSGTQGRFGSVSVTTNVFTPSGPWYDIVR